MKQPVPATACKNREKDLRSLAGPGRRRPTFWSTPGPVQPAPDRCEGWHSRGRPALVSCGDDAWAVTTRARGLSQRSCIAASPRWRSGPILARRKDAVITGARPWTTDTHPPRDDAALAVTGLKRAPPSHVTRSGRDGHWRYALLRRTRRPGLRPARDRARLATSSRSDVDPEELTQRSRDKRKGRELARAELFNLADMT